MTPTVRILRFTGSHFLPLLVTAAAACTTAQEVPECRVWSDCPEPLACRAGACVSPVLPQPAEWATQTATFTGTDANILINGRLVRPAGTAVTVGTFPVRMAIHPDGQFAVINENGWGTYTSPARDRRAHYLRVVDARTNAPVSEFRMPHDRMGIGLVFNRSGDRLYVPGGDDEHLYAFALSPTGGVTLAETYAINDCFGMDVTVTADDTRAYVSCYTENQVFEVDLTNPAATPRKMRANAWPYEIEVTPDGRRVFVSNAATTFDPQPGDTVTAIDPASGRVEAMIPVGLGPEGLAISADGRRLYVANNKTDDVHVIDTETYQVVAHWSLHADSNALVGIYPTSVVLDEAARRLYLTGAQENLVAVLDLASGERLGDIPTEWYPNHVALSPDGDRLSVLSGYGRGDGPSNVAGRYADGSDRVSSGRQLHGSVFTIPVPTAAELKAMTAIVAENNDRQSRYFDMTEENDSALPWPTDTRPSPIHYVFFVFKENFSFDGTYGQFGRGRADPTLQLWPKEVLVNQWALAMEFTLFDNFYCDGEGSTDGHQWAAAAIEPDFMQRGMIMDYGGLGGPQVVVSLDPGTMPKSKLFLPHLLAQGIDAFGYGGLENFGANGYTDYADNWLRDYKWNLETGPRDRERAQMFIDDFNKRVANGRVAQFNWIFFPNNHTLGLQMGEPIPESMVADNDEAVGMVVDAVSHSPVWDESLIIVFEDDAQGAYDHIEKHRCPALAIGPWVKRGYVSAVQYSFPNFHRTVEAILGAAPMNRFDQKASPMYDIFTARPNTTPYDLIPRTPEVLYDGTNGGIGSDKLARSMDWSGIDRNENQAEFFWRYLGKGPLPPAAIRDAHFLPDD